MLIIKKRQKIYVPDNLAILSSWKIIAPVVAEEIRISDYTPVPYCFDTNAYKLGYIFAPINTKVIGSSLNTSRCPRDALSFIAN